MAFSRITTKLKQSCNPCCSCCIVRRAPAPPPSPHPKRPPDWPPPVPPPIHEIQTWEKLRKISIAVIQHTVPCLPVPRSPKPAPAPYSPSDLSRDGSPSPTLSAQTASRKTWHFTSFQTLTQNLTDLNALPSTDENIIALVIGASSVRDLWIEMREMERGTAELIAELDGFEAARTWIKGVRDEREGVKDLVRTLVDRGKELEGSEVWRNREAAAALAAENVTEEEEDEEEVALREYRLQRHKEKQRQRYCSSPFQIRLGAWEARVRALDW